MKQRRCCVSLCGLAVAILLSTPMLIGCAKTVYPVTTGYHVPITEEMLSKKYRVVVWGNHPAMANTIIGLVQQEGHSVVERARLQEVFNEQEIRLTHSPDDHADILRVGRLLGADRVIFAEVMERTHVGLGGGRKLNFGERLALSNPDHAALAQAITAYQVSVSVRGVDVETGEIEWSGTAHYPEPVGNPEQAVIMLVRVAMARALCLVGTGYEWRERTSEHDEWGCIKK